MNEIPTEVNALIEKLKNFDVKDESKKNAWDTVKEDIINDFEWLAEKSNSHATIDTYAKKLWLQNDVNQLNKVKSVLSLFFIIEQMINKADSRYDTFLANILSKDFQIPDAISIFTWNYDSQFELAFQEYSSKITLPKDVGVSNYNDTGEDKCMNPKIFKLNGSASFIDLYSLGKFCKNSKEELNYRLLENTAYLYQNYCYSGNYQASKLSFSWEQNSDRNSFIETACKRIENASSIVIIGYTFPFFNRQTDRYIFNYLQSLKNIYIQDPNANMIEQNLQPVIPQTISDKIKVYHITNTSQFFLPPEL